MKTNRLEAAMSNGSVSALLGVLKIADENAYKSSIAVAQMTDRYISLLMEEGVIVWSKEEQIHIIEGALLHDIGKAFLPFNLQYMTRPLSLEEFEIVKIHPLTGLVAVKNCNFDEIVTDIILMHHANGDGSGYPVLNHQPFTMENVPEHVWVVSYVDRFVAMTTKRPYKREYSYPEAWRHIVDMTRKDLLPYHLSVIFGELVKKESLLDLNYTEELNGNMIIPNPQKKNSLLNSQESFNDSLVSMEIGGGDTIEPERE